jgi:hypothetical protein
VGSRAVLDAVVKRKIPSPHRKSKPRTPIVQDTTENKEKERQKDTRKKGKKTRNKKKEESIRERKWGGGRERETHEP